MFDSPVQLRLWLPAATGGWHRFDLGIRIGQLDLHNGPRFDTVAVHVDLFEDSLRQVLFHGSRQLRHEEGKEDRQLLRSWKWSTMNSP